MALLTSKAIERFKPRAGVTLDIRFDSWLRGFGVRVFESGKKSFIVRYVDETGKRKIRTIEDCHKMRLEDARIEAAKIIAGAAKVSKIRQTLGGAVPTFAEFAAKYIELYAKSHRRSWETDLGRLRRHIFPKLANLRLTAVKTVDCLALHAAITLEKKKPVEANRCLQLIQAIFNKAEEWGAFEGKNPTKGVKKNRERSRDRWVSEEEMPRLIAAIKEEKNVFARSAILLYLTTGLRKSEILGAKWSEVNWTEKTLTISKNKSDETYTVFLSSLAISVLCEIPRLPENPFIICGKNPGSRLVNIRKPWTRIRANANLEDVTLHDLRRTFGSWLVNAGHNMRLIADALNHSDLRSVKTYARLSKKAVAEAVEEHGKKLSQLLQ